MNAPAAELATTVSIAVVPLDFPSTFSLGRCLNAALSTQTAAMTRHSAPRLRHTYFSWHHCATRESGCDIHVVTLEPSTTTRTALQFETLTLCDIAVFLCPKAVNLERLDGRYGALLRAVGCAVHVVVPGAATAAAQPATHRAALCDGRVPVALTHVALRDVGEHVLSSLVEAVAPLVIDLAGACAAAEERRAASRAADSASLRMQLVSRMSKQRVNIVRVLQGTVRVGDAILVHADPLRTAGEAAGDQVSTVASLHTFPTDVPLTQATTGMYVGVRCTVDVEANARDAAPTGATPSPLAARGSPFDMFSKNVILGHAHREHFPKLPMLLAIRTRLGRLAVNDVLVHGFGGSCKARVLHDGPTAKILLADDRCNTLCIDFVPPAVRGRGPSATGTDGSRSSIAPAAGVALSLQRGSKVDAADESFVAADVDMNATLHKLGAHARLAALLERSLTSNGGVIAPEDLGPVRRFLATPGDAFAAAAVAAAAPAAAPAKAAAAAAKPAMTVLDVVAKAPRPGALERLRAALGNELLADVTPLQHTLALNPLSGAGGGRRCFTLLALITRFRCPELFALALRRVPNRATPLGSAAANVDALVFNPQPNCFHGGSLWLPGAAPATPASPDDVERHATEAIAACCTTKTMTDVFYEWLRCHPTRRKELTSSLLKIFAGGGAAMPVFHLVCGEAPNTPLARTEVELLADSPVLAPWVLLHALLHRGPSVDVATMLSRKPTVPGGQGQAALVRWAACLKALLHSSEMRGIPLRKAAVAYLLVHAQYHVHRRHQLPSFVLERVIAFL